MYHTNWIEGPWWSGTFVSESVIRVPLIIRGSGIAPGRIADVVRLIDVTVVPGDGDEVRLPAPAAGELLAKMERRMALKDAEIALVVEQHAATLDAFLSWNAKHFPHATWISRTWRAS
jgi:hypothetical protein